MQTNVKLQPKFQQCCFVFHFSREKNSGCNGRRFVDVPRPHSAKRPKLSWLFYVLGFFCYLFATRRRLFYNVVFPQREEIWCRQYPACRLHSVGSTKHSNPFTLIRPGQSFSGHHFSRGSSKAISTLPHPMRTSLTYTLSGGDVAYELATNSGCFKSSPSKH